MLPPFQYMAHALDDSLFAAGSPVLIVYHSNSHQPSSQAPRWSREPYYAGLYLPFHILISSRSIGDRKPRDTVLQDSIAAIAPQANRSRGHSAMTSREPIASQKATYHSEEARREPRRHQAYCGIYVQREMERPVTQASANLLNGSSAVMQPDVFGCAHPVPETQVPPQSPPVFDASILQ